MKRFNHYGSFEGFNWNHGTFFGLVVVIFLLTPNPSNQLCVTRVTPGLVDFFYVSGFGVNHPMVNFHHNAPNSTAVEFGQECVCFFGGEGIFVSRLHPTKKKPSKPIEETKPIWKNPPPYGHGIFLPCPLGPLRPATHRECRSAVGLETPGKSRPESGAAEWEGGGFSLQQNVGICGGCPAGS